MRKSILFSMVLMAASLPLAAQEFAPAPNLNNPPLPVFNSIVSTTAVSAPAPVPALRLDARRASTTVTRDFTLAVARINETHASAIDSMYEFMETPFASSVSVPMASVAGGRFQLAGYHSMVSSENFQMGLPGAGVLPSWGIGLQSHPIVNVPQNNECAGFNVTIHFRSTEPGPVRLRPVEAVNRAVTFLRGI